MMASLMRPKPKAPAAAPPPTAIASADEHVDQGDATPGVITQQPDAEEQEGQRDATPDVTDVDEHLVVEVCGSDAKEADEAARAIAARLSQEEEMVRNFL